MRVLLWIACSRRWSAWAGITLMMISLHSARGAEETSSPEATPPPAATPAAATPDPDKAAKLKEKVLTIGRNFIRDGAETEGALDSLFEGVLNGLESSPAGRFGTLDPATRAEILTTLRTELAAARPGAAPNPPPTAPTSPSDPAVEPTHSLGSHDPALGRGNPPPDNPAPGNNADPAAPPRTGDAAPPAGPNGPAKPEPRVIGDTRPRPPADPPAAIPTSGGDRPVAPPSRDSYTGTAPPSSIPTHRSGSEGGGGPAPSHQGTQAGSAFSPFSSSARGEASSGARGGGEPTQLKGGSSLALDSERRFFGKETVESTKGIAYNVPEAPESRSPLTETTTNLAAVAASWDAQEKKTDPAPWTTSKGAETPVVSASAASAAAPLPVSAASAVEIKSETIIKRVVEAAAPQPAPAPANRGTDLKGLFRAFMQDLLKSLGREEKTEHSRLAHATKPEKKSGGAKPAAATKERFREPLLSAAGLFSEDHGEGEPLAIANLEEIDWPSWAGATGLALCLLLLRRLRSRRAKP